MNKEVEFLKEESIDSYIEFIDKVFDYQVDRSNVKKLIGENKVLVIMNQNKVIAAAILEKSFEYIRNSYYYKLSYLGVLREYRRMGYASRIFEKVEELVKENNIKYLELISGNQRIAAHYFYQKNGFKIKDTTVFVKIY